MTRYRVVIYSPDGIPQPLPDNCYATMGQAETAASRRRDEIERRGWNYTVCVEPCPEEVQ